MSRMRVSTDIVIVDTASLRSLSMPPRVARNCVPRPDAILSGSGRDEYGLLPPRLDEFDCGQQFLQTD